MELLFVEGMFICSTILYFGDLPVGYSFLKNETGYWLQPAADTASPVTPPMITVTQLGKEWKVTGIESEDLVQQVQKLIAVNGFMELPEELSAAS